MSEELFKELFIPNIRILLPADDKKITNQYISLYNGKKDIYESVYYYVDEPLSQNAIVSWIFLDFDFDNDYIFFDDVKTVAKYLHHEDIWFYIRFSGRGFHIFIEVIDSDYKNPKKAIKTFVKELHTITNTTSDPAVVGDLRRVARKVNTINTKTGLYCIPLTYTQLITMSYSDICALAKDACSFPFLEQKQGIMGYGIDLTKYDSEEEEDVKIEIKNIKNFNFIDKIPICIEELMKNSELGYKERGLVILYLRDMGYTEEETINVLHNFLSEEKFHHSVFEENQVNYLYNREDILFNSCSSMKLDGLCPSSTCTGNNLYL